MTITWSLGDVLARRPKVRINQCGYLPHGPKAATWVTVTSEPAEFRVVSAEGAVAFRGRSQPWPDAPEPSSGLSVHVLDFTTVDANLGACRLEAGGDTSHVFRISNDVYGRLASDALRVLYLLRSGCEIDEVRAPGYGRPAGHVGVPPNLGDTAVEPWSGPDAARLYPGWSPGGTYDVSGGWYDAGDYGKYVTSGAVAVWQLLQAARPATDLVADVLAECRWQLDWLLRMQVPAGRPLAGMAFHRVHGIEWSPVPGWAHRDPTPRVLHRPSTSATLQLAAVTAAAARVFAADADYAARLVAVARTAWAAARDNPVLVAPDDEGRFGGGPYGDRDPGDDRYWAAVELWLTTGDSGFRNEFERSPLDTGHVFDTDGFDFDNVAAPARLDLALMTREEQAVASVRAAADRLLDLARRQPWGQPYAPVGGWNWGSNGRLLNNLVVLAVAHELTGERRYLYGVVGGLDYVFGRNALGQSYVVGYGPDSSAHLRTRQFGHDLDPAMPPPPRGALAGGANSTVTPGFPQDPRLAGLPPQQCYLDEPTSETTNDLCIRWNTPLVYIATYLDALSS